LIVGARGAGRTRVRSALCERERSFSRRRSRRILRPASEGCELHLLISTASAPLLIHPIFRHAAKTSCTESYPSGAAQKPTKRDRSPRSRKRLEKRTEEATISMPPKPHSEGYPGCGRRCVGRRRDGAQRARIDRESEEEVLVPVGAQGEPAYPERATSGPTRAS